MSGGSNSRFLRIYLSWNNGLNEVTVAPQELPDSDGILSYGGSTETLGRSWAESDFSNTNFVLSIREEQLGYRQSYKNFNFGLSGISSIDGILVAVDGHKEGSYNPFIDHIQVKVHYTE